MQGFIKLYKISILLITLIFFLVEAGPVGDAPITYEWSTILLPGGVPYYIRVFTVYIESQNHNHDLDAEASNVIMIVSPCSVVMIFTATFEDVSSNWNNHDVLSWCGFSHQMNCVWNRVNA